MARKVIHRRRNPRGKADTKIMLIAGAAGVVAWQQGMLAPLGVAKPAKPWFGLGAGTVQKALTSPTP
jgi:hypothetical protein